MPAKRPSVLAASIRDRLGLRGKLLFAFLGISAFAVLAVAVALYSFVRAGEALDRITRDRVPAAIASQQLSRQAEKIVAFAPALLSVASAEQHGEVTAGITAEMTLLRAQLETLRGLDVDGQSCELIDKLVFLLGINLNTVDTMMYNQLALIEHRRELLRRLSFADLSSRRLLAPGLIVMDAKLAEIRDRLERADKSTAGDSLALDALARPLVSHVPVQAAQSQVFVINETLLKASAADSLETLDVMRFPLQRALDGLAEAIEAVDSELSNQLGARLVQFRQLADGRDSIPRARRIELEQLASIRTLLDQNADISARLTQSVDRLVAGAIGDIEIATGDALAVQQTSSLIMIAVALASIASSTLIVGLYVGGSLIRRLSGLAHSMESIAGGDLEAAIPTAGGDEIGRMAEALEIFRDTAREVRASNLREIRAARQRLNDAIESIDAAFSLYDADERLLLCNSRLRKMFAPIADVLEPGTRFEDIVRRAAASGQIADTAAGDEAWIERRLRQFREKQGPHRQHLADGRWLQIDESPTRDGGTVAVYSDITELVGQSQKLEQWNRDLEQRVAMQVRELHNIEQLKRYFPPQLTEAIVSDDQASALQDHRREVTVIFCDLRGFTEFSSTAEPEEEMRVLREYHAVVCPLIFEYGATLEHFAGDGVMSFLNDPIPYDDHVERAVNMAIAMRSGINALRRDWHRRGIELGFGIGIGTGFATLGRIGSPQQFHYAAIGSVANLAARLCDEAGHDQILISQSVYSAVEGRFRTEPMPELKLKGFPRPVPSYNVLE